MKARIQANALALARNGTPRKSVYLTGQLGGKPFTLHGEGERVFLREQEGEREEVDLVIGHESGNEPDLPDPSSGEQAPGQSHLEDGLGKIARALPPPEDPEEEVKP
jgi:hypothetical protein